MSSKKIAVIAIPVAGVLIALFFIPTNEFFGISSHNPEPTSPMMIFEGSDEMSKGFKITPLTCNESYSGLTESHFLITNTHNQDYDVQVSVSFTDNYGILYEKEVIVRLLAGETKDQIHLSDDIYDNPICVVRVSNWSDFSS